MGLHMKLRRFLATACAFGALCNLALAADQVFVTNEGSGDVSVIDSRTDAVIQTIATGGKPRGVAICRNGAHVYVSNQHGSQLQAINTQTYAIDKTLTLGESPEAVYCSPDGQWVAVANEGSNSVSFVSTSRWKVQFSIPVRGKNPEHAVFSPNG
jgi:YVTN family beta-propeller protein